MNGTRLGLYHLMEKYDLTKGRKGSVSTHQSIACGAISGAFGAFVASPFYLVIQFQGIKRFKKSYLTVSTLSRAVKDATAEPIKF